MAIKNQKERMIAGELYDLGSATSDLKELFQQSRKYMRLYNQTTEEQLDERKRILKEWLGKCDDTTYIEPSFKCDYGFNIKLGSHFYANFDCIILDVCPVTIGDHVMVGPRVSMFTAAHPLDATIRASGLEYGSPITIGNHVWIGGGTIINPGVKIGDNCVIGSGSVVTQNIPANIIAVGNPCRVLRPLTEQDSAYWNQQAKIFWNEQSSANES